MKMKRIMALILSCLMLFSSVYAQEAEISLGTVFSETQTLPEETEDSTQGPEQIQGAEVTEKNGYFSDVAADSEYAQAVDKMVKSGIIDGYGDNTFRPENGVTRAEMCKMINLTFNYTEYDAAEGFFDVTEDKWYAPYVLAAQQIGYVEGYEDGSFRGENNITRQEVCMIINRIINPMDLSEFGMTVDITDEVSDWAKEAVERVVMNNFMPLEENNTFRAKENIKRYELAMLLSLFVIPPAEPLTATVRFFDGNGNQIGENDTVYIGDYPTVPQAPAHADESYEFAGWRVVGQTELIDAENYMVLNDTDYEAVYKLKTFKVEFYDGGTLYNEIEVVYGNAPTEPENAPEMSGYDFLGWSFSSGGEVVNLASLVVYDNMTFYAVFQKSENSPGGGNGNNDD
ncbi:MAG: S-layer homology domain-containing protein, partial [Ruminococcus sp.]|nr:S-layer homology domain-containing protein [Ruminococcus sp.]